MNIEVVKANPDSKTFLLSLETRIVDKRMIKTANAQGFIASTSAARITADNAMVE